tara:strand:+ start:1602 stop:5804 length:4203 start_codon:yes stop_codon:yes gene_type:complete
MAQSLTGKTIADTYIYLLRVNADDSTLGEYNAAPYSISTGVGDPYPIFFNKERVLIAGTSVAPNASLDVRAFGSSAGDIECVKLRISETGTIGTTSDTDLIKLSSNLVTVNGVITTTSNVNVGGNLVVTGTSTFNGGTITIGDATSDKLVLGASIDSSIIPDDDGTYNLGSSTKEWNNIYIDGTAYVDSLEADTVNIDGGNIDGTAIGSVTPSTGSFTNATITTVDINGGAIDGTPIGANSAATGAFNGLTITGSTSFPNDSISGNAINGGSISGVTNYAGTDATLTGTANALKLVVDTNVLVANPSSYDNKVGINTATPSDQLEVTTPSGNAYIAIDSANDSEAGLKLVENGTTKWQLYNDGDASDKLLLKDDGDVRVTFAQTGRVGIGVADPTDEKLEVAGAIVIGDAEASAGATANGAIKYAGGDFMGYKAGSWVTLTAVPGTSSAAGWTLHGSNYVYLTTGGDQVSVGGGAPTDGTVKLDVDGTIRGEGWHANTQMDVTSGANDPGVHGLVPAPTTGDTAKFLRGDATWQSPATAAIGDIGDVTIAGAADGEMLMYDAGSSKWIDQLPSVTTASTASFSAGGAAATLSYNAPTAVHTFTPMAMPTKADLDIDHLTTLSGVGAASDHLGTFTGSTIADNQNTKQALQALETSVEGKIASGTAVFTANVAIDKHSGTALGDLSIRGNLSVNLSDSTSGYQTASITGASKANPCVITVGAGGGGHGFSTGDRVNINSVVGMTELNSIGTTTITYIDATNFSLDGVDSSGYTTYGSGGKAEAVRIIQSDNHGLLLGDSVGMPTGLSGAEEIFTIDSINGTNEFTVDSDPTTLPDNDTDFGQVKCDSHLLAIQNADQLMKFLVDKSGNTALGLSSANSGSYAGEHTVLTLAGISSATATSTGILEFHCPSNDADNLALGQITTYLPEQHADHRKPARIQFLTDGTTATKYGGRIDFDTKQDNSTSMGTKMCIRENGDIGMGTTDPEGLLHLKDDNDSDTNPILFLESTSASADTAPDLRFYRNSSSPADNDYIGHLNFVGNNDAGTPEKISYADIFARIKDASDGSEDGALIFRTFVAGTDDDTMYIGGGKVGIGTADIDADGLEINKGVDGEMTGLMLTNSNSTNDTDDTVKIRMSADARQKNSANIIVGKTEDYSEAAKHSAVMSLHVTTDGTSARYMTLRDGRIGMGSAVSAPAHPVHIQYSQASNNVLKVANSTGDNDSKCMTLMINHNGDPTTDNAYLEFDDAHATLDEFQGDGSGGIQFTGNAAGTTSDRRVKKDIADLTGSLAKINAIKPRTFKYTDEFLDQSFQNHKIKDWQKKTQMGFVAQELGEVFPDILESVKHTVKKDNVDYDGKTYKKGDEVEIIQTNWGRRGTLILFSNLVKAVQELSAKVEALEKK